MFQGALSLREETSAGSAVFVDPAGIQLEVGAPVSGVWSMEIRYDLHFGTPRQPFTGVQGTLSPLPLSVETTVDRARLTAGGSALELDLTSGAFLISGGGHRCFESSPLPFQAHSAPVEVFEGLMSLKVTDFSVRSPHITPGTTFASRMVRFSFPRPTGPVLGLPGQTGELNRNGYRFELYNTDEFLHTPARRPMYQSWPIVIYRGESSWVGIFHDNPSRTFVDLGDFYPERVTFEAVTGNTRIYVVLGDSLEEVTHGLVRLLGPSVFPPAWAFGYQQCRWSYMSTAEIRAVAQGFRSRDIPCDALYFDIDYMNGFRVFTRDSRHFGDLAECLADLRNEEFRSVCIVDPGVKVDFGYSVYDRVMTEGAVLRTAEGAPLPVRVWAGRSVLPDFGDPATRSLWAELQAEWLAEYPFDGIWNDMNEPSNFDGQNAATAKAVTTRGSIGPEYNLYGSWMAEASAAGWHHHAPHHRSLVITRSGYPGVQRHAVIWHGDNQAWWEHLRLALETAVQYSLCGAIFTGADLPGFTGNPPDDLAVRFFQLGALLPFFRGHSMFFAKDKEPWAFAAPAQAHIIAAIRLRYSLLREWYSAFELAVRTGQPLLTPVLDEAGHVARDQFMIGGKLLVAPVVERDVSRRLVLFPPGIWYPLGDPHTPITGGSWQVIPVDLSSLPVFVRGGTILTRGEPRATVARTFAAPERFEVYPSADGAARGYWFNDDGISSSGSGAERWNLELDQAGRVIRTPHPV